MVVTDHRPLTSLLLVRVKQEQGWALKLGAFDVLLFIEQEHTLQMLMDSLDRHGKMRRKNALEPRGAWFSTRTPRSLVAGDVRVRVSHLKGEMGLQT